MKPDDRAYLKRLKHFDYRRARIAAGWVPRRAFRPSVIPAYGDPALEKILEKYDDVFPNIRASVWRTLAPKSFFTPYISVRRGGFEGNRIVGLAEAVQDSDLVQLRSAMQRLSPSVRGMLTSIIEGVEIEDAAREMQIDETQLSILLPRLRVFLRPYLY